MAQFEGAETPKLGMSRPGMVTVMPVAEPCETTFVTVTMDKNFSVDSPDHQEAPLTCTTKWISQESFTEGEQPSSRFFPDDADRESSSTSAENEHGKVDSQPASDRDRSDTDATGMMDDDGNSGSSKSEERNRDERGRVSFPPRGSNETRYTSRLQVPDTTSVTGADAVLPARPGESATKELTSVQPDVGVATLGAPWWTVGQKTTIMLVALGMLALGMCIGAHGRHTASSVRSPATALVRYGQPVARRTAKSTTLGDKLGLQVLAVEHMRIAHEAMLEMHEAWSVLAAVAAQEDSFNHRDESRWPRFSGSTGALLPSGDEYIQTFDRPSFKCRSFPEELMNGPWV